MSAMLEPLAAGWSRWWPGVALVAAGLLGSSVFVLVDESELVMIERLGRVTAVYDEPAERGLQWKLPWPISRVRRFDRRLQVLAPPGREFFTKDRKNLVLEAYVCWRIAESPSPSPSSTATSNSPDVEPSPTGSDPVQASLAQTSFVPASSTQSALVQAPAVRFFRGVGSLAVAQERLSSRLQSVLASHVAKYDLSELLTADSSDSAPAALTNDARVDDDRQAVEPASGVVGEQAVAAADHSSLPLQQLIRQIQHDLSQTPGEPVGWAESLGLEIVDVGLRRIHLPAGNQPAVYERMRSERQKIAERYRSAGQAESARIRSEADRQAAEILAAAEAEAARIEATAEADALQRMVQAGQADPEFAEFIQALDAYQKVLTERATIVLSAGSPLWSLLMQGVPSPDAMPPDGSASQVLNQAVADPLPKSDASAEPSPVADPTASTNAPR
jgi:modulator of FtsH protease HflC